MPFGTPGAGVSRSLGVVLVFGMAAMVGAIPARAAELGFKAAADGGFQFDTGVLRGSSVSGESRWACRR